MGIGSIAGTYANFILGTGSEDVAKVIKATVKNRKAAQMGYARSIWTGTRQGIRDSYQATKANGGYFRNLWKSFGEIPAGVKNGAGFTGKIGGFFKGCGKAMPALMAFMMVAGEIPNVFKATKEQGVGQGAKEVGKAAARLTGGALGAAICSAIIPVPLLGSLVGWMAGDWLAGKIVGKSYTEKVEADPNAYAKKPEEQKTDATASNPAAQANLATTPQSGSVVGPVAGMSGGAGQVAFTGSAAASSMNPQGAFSSSSQLPSIDDQDFGPNRPYSNIFFPGNFAGGEYLGGGMGALGMGMPFGMGMGMGMQNAQNPNLLTPTGQNNYPSSNLTTYYGSTYGNPNNNSQKSSGSLLNQLM